MNLKPYSDYRERTNRYLPSVPSHWKAARFKLFTEESEERSAEGNELLLSVSEYTGVSPRSTIVEEGEHLSRAESLEGYKVCRPGDLVMNIMLAWKKAQGVSAYYGIVSPAYSVYSLKDRANPRFIHYLTRAQIYADYFKSFSSGVIDSRLRLYPDTFLGLKTDLPPREEQSAIAEFLDRETAKIDALIAEQQRLIELLQEKRQAVISHAVTKGLNPDTPMKDSGVEWLGEVPDHWIVTQLRHFTRSLPGFAFPSDGFVQDESKWKLLRGVNVGVSCIRWDDTVYWDREADDRLDQYVLSPGDLVVGLDRPMIKEGLRVARIAQEDCPCILLQRVAAVKGTENLSTDYLFFLLSSPYFLAHFEPETTGVSVPHISTGQIDSFVVPIPPPQEQAEIVSFLSAQLNAIRRLTGESSNSTLLLQERRSALISAAVTGQIDVRGLAPETSAA
jgi:type I restriction enzyme S subunit